MTTEMIPVLDYGYVKLIEHWGSDERIIEAARMSTNKGFEGWGPFGCKKCNATGWLHDLNYDGTAFEQPMCSICRGSGKVPGDEKLLKYLWEHKHTSPFEMAGAVFEVYAPIFVVREWQRHRVQALSEGLSFNEMSGRYVELPDDYYIPSLERLMAGGQGAKNKQASGSSISMEEAKLLQGEIEMSCAESRRTYRWVLERGLSRELARLVLPVNQYSRMRVSANLWGWLHFLGLRMRQNAQWEIVQYANAVGAELLRLFPRTYELFEEALHAEAGHEAL